MGRARRQRENERRGYASVDDSSDSGSRNSPNLPVALTAAASLVVALIFLCIRPLFDPDTWFHLAFGEQFLSSGAIPRVDIFSHTAEGRRWISSGWLSSVLLAWVNKSSPDSSTGLIVLTFLVALAGYGLVWWRGLRSGSVATVTVLLIAGALAATVRFTPRPDLFSQVCMAALLLLLGRQWVRPEQTSIPAAAGVPVLVALWANLHAGVFAALPLLALHFLWVAPRLRSTNDKRWPFVAGLTIAAAFAWLANPYGWRLAQLPSTIAGYAEVGWVYEWMPLFRRGFSLPWTVYGGLAVLVAAAIWIFRRRPRQHTWPFLAAAAYLCVLVLMQRRQVGLAAVGLPALLAPFAGHLERRFNRRIRLAAPPLAAACVVLLQFSGVPQVGEGRPRIGRDCSRLPCIATDFLAQFRPPGQIFNPYGMGAYLLYHLKPDTKVFIDGRLDVYPESVWLDYLAVDEGRMPLAAFAAKYDISTWVVDMEGAIGDALSLGSRLSLDPSWALVHFDDRAAIFAKTTGDGSDYVRKHGYQLLSPWKVQQIAPAIRDQAAAKRLIGEVGRALEQSADSATANAMAARVAWTAGDQETALLHRQKALDRRPRHPLLAAWPPAR